MGLSWSELWGGDVQLQLGMSESERKLRRGFESEVILSTMEVSPRTLRRRYAQNTLIPGPGLHSSINPTSSLFNQHSQRSKWTKTESVLLGRCLMGTEEGGGSHQQWTKPGLCVHTSDKKEGRAGEETHSSMWLAQDEEERSHNKDRNEILALRSMAVLSHLRVKEEMRATMYKCH